MRDEGWYLWRILAPKQGHSSRRGGVGAIVRGRRRGMDTAVHDVKRRTLNAEKNFCELCDLWGSVVLTSQH